MSVSPGAICDVKRWFFDRGRVKHFIDTAHQKALGRIGSYVRKVARNSIRTRAGISEPGQPPHSHTGLLKDWILFSYDKESLSVVVGPARLNMKSGDALEALEYGGAVHSVRRGRRMFIRARPFMGPAMEKSAPFDRFWKDSVKA
jgi:hypothetical protein